jgi:hypothetical protein
MSVEPNSANRDDLVAWVLGAVRRNSGEACVLQVARDIWDRRRADLEQAGDLFYTWQYDMRWGVRKLRIDARLRPSQECA